MQMTKDHAYLYLGSVSEARRYNELDKWRDSHEQNVLCKQAIEDSIRRDFDGMNLDQASARSVIEEYGFKRVGWVLASTLQQKKADGRFSPRNKEWAASNFIPRSERNHDFTVQSHPAVLDGFVNQFRKELEQLQMFDLTHCTTMMGQNLEGKVLVMSPYTLKESYWAPENQLWLASGGFGCNPTAAGRAVYATCLGDGEHARWNREDFIGILDEQHLPTWAQSKLAELCPSTQEQTADPIMGGMTMG